MGGTVSHGFFNRGRPMTAVRPIPLAGTVLIPAGAELGSKFLPHHRLKRLWNSKAIGVSGTGWVNRQLKIAKAEPDGGKFVESLAEAKRKAAEQIESDDKAGTIEAAIQAADDAEKAAVDAVAAAEAAEERAHELASHAQALIDAADAETAKELPDDSPGNIPAKDAHPDDIPPETPAPDPAPEPKPAAKKKASKKKAAK